MITLPGCTSNSTSLNNLSPTSPIDDTVSNSSTAKPDAKEPTNTTVSDSNFTSDVDSASLEDILSEFHHQSFLLKNSTTQAYTSRTSNLDNEMNKLREETVTKLTDAGYEAYNVTKNTFSTVESLIGTDLSKMGLSPEHEYIVVVGTEDVKMARSYNDEEIRTDDAFNGVIGDSFVYTYNNERYALRYVTVTAAEVPDYVQISAENLLEDEPSLLVDLLMEGIYIGIDIFADPAPIGTIASICGLVLEHFGPEYTSTLYMHASSCWTRVFTQVWDINLESWFYTSSVEYVDQTVYFSGQYYDADLNRVFNVPERYASKRMYSDKFNNYTWRKEKAIWGKSIGVPQRDLTGDVTYYYDNQPKIIHHESF